MALLCAIQLPSRTSTPRLNKYIYTSHALRDENGSNSHEIGSRRQLLLYFNLNSNTDIDLVEYECKMNVSNSDFYSNIYSTQLKVHIVKFNVDE